MEIITMLILALMASFLLSKAITSRTKQSKEKLIDKLPGPRKYPIIGTTKDMLTLRREDVFEFFLKESNNYGPIYRTWIGNLGCVHLNKAEHLKHIFSSSKHIAKGQIYDNLRPLLKDGLISSNGGPLWKRNRKLITPSFHFKILDSFVEVFNDRMEAFIDRISTHTNKQFDMYPMLANYALDVICETAMGVQINAITKTTDEYINAVNQLGELAVLRLFKPWYKSDFIYYRSNQGKRLLRLLEIVLDFSKKIITDKKKSATPTLSIEQPFSDKKRRLSFLDLLLDTAKDSELTDYEIQQEVDTFMAAGYETTTTASSWCLFLLGNHPEIQERVREEINLIFPDNIKLTIKELNKMKYLDCVVKETLRLYPSIPTTGRVLSEDVVIDGYTIPAGTTMRIHIYNVHRDPDHYQEPNKFDPDRFLPENCRNRHPYAFVPFAAGPRNCIGQNFALYEVKTMISWIIKNYKVIAVENQKTLKVYKDIVLKPQNGLQVVLERL